MQPTQINEPMGIAPFPALKHARVADVMRAGVIVCPANAELRALARTMAIHRIHALVVEVEPGRWSVISDMALIAALADGREPTAADLADGVMTIAPDAPLSKAAELMRDRDTAHLLVVDEGRHVPLGMLSTLDIASAVAFGIN